MDTGGAVTDNMQDKEGFLPRRDLGMLFDILSEQGYRIIGPQSDRSQREGAIVYDELNGPASLPAGFHDHQAAGQYRLKRDDSRRYFAWANGPQALKPLLFSPRETLWQAARDEEGRLHFSEYLPDPLPTAVLGVRACDLAALALQDAHFLNQHTPDPYYRKRRDSLFLVAVDCSHPADTCFCVSSGDGPDARQGYDLALTELDDGFLCRAGSESGRAVLKKLPLNEQTPGQTAAAQAQHEQAVKQQQRRLPENSPAGRLRLHAEHPQWEKAAERCLACGNCTSVCPTCFCYSEHDVAVLAGEKSEHIREWDSCFTMGHSYIHGHVVRGSTRERYRQWLTHKFDTWYEQYGRSGCTGCGRCISWCPTGIDVTEELEMICADE